MNAKHPITAAKLDRFFKRLYASNQKFIQKIRLENKKMKEDFQNTAMFLNENLVHDFRGIFSDRHEERIVRIEHLLKLP
ncbi:hypothetical protein EXS70_05035 [Candidatus Peribacteria bacterium]|nr:hypothetical protein [Candidatus Peribacteria bacterium]